MGTIAAEAAGKADEPGAGRRRWLPMALPRLTGRWLKAYRAFWFLTLFASLAASVAGFHYHIVIDDQWSEPYLELGLRPASSTGTVLGLPVGEETRRAGILPKSKLIAIDGVRLPAQTTQAEVANRLRAVRGDHVNIRTRLPDGSEREHRLRRTGDHVKQAYAASGVSADTKHLIEFVLGLLAMAMTLAAAILLFRKAGGEPVASLFSYALLLGILVGEPAKTLYVYFGWQALLLKLIGIAGTALVLTMFVFPNGRFQSRWSLFATVVYGLLALFPPSQGAVAALLATLSLPIIVFAVVSIALRYRRLKPSAERQQIRWAFFGFAASFVSGGLYLALLLWALVTTNEQIRIWSMIGSEVAQQLSIVVLIACLMVALLRYRLYDAEAVISRSTGYAVLTIMLGAVFSASSKGIEWMFEANFGRDAGALSGAAGAGVAVLLITPLRKRVHGWAEKRFKKGLLDLRKQLPLCVGDLRETAGMDQLLDTVLARIAAGVRATQTAVLLRSPEGWQVAAGRGVDKEEVRQWAAEWTAAPNEAGLDRNRSDPSFPLRVALTVEVGLEPETIGWIILGPRPDGSFYGKDEQEALAEIADPVARAVQIVKLREEREETGREQIEQLYSRLGSLEATLAAALEGIMPKRPARA